MYNNIGEKLKALAKVIAWLGIIGTLIWGIVLTAQGCELSSHSYLEEAGATLTGTGISVMILGPILSWISSWALYAIGDTNVKASESHYKSITTTHTFRCEKCGSMISGFPCITCGYNPDKVSNSINTKPYQCGNCGYLGPYDGNCPKCGSSIKRYIIPVNPIVLSKTEVKCPKCGTKQPSGRKHCVKCVIPFNSIEVKLCSKCGSQLLNDEIFCSDCGAKVTGNEKTASIGKCEMCDKENTVIQSVRIVNQMGIRHRKVCDECLRKYNCQPE